jgi:hypothetical protein
MFKIQLMYPKLKINVYFIFLNIGDLTFGITLVAYSELLAFYLILFSQSQFQYSPPFYTLFSKLLEIFRIQFCRLYISHLLHAHCMSRISHPPLCDKLNIWYLTKHKILSQDAIEFLP